MTPPEGKPHVAPVDAGSESASSSGRWREIQRVVDGALDLPPAERDAFVSEACGPDVALSVQARQLLEACERAAGSDGFLAGPAGAFAAPMIAEFAVQDAAAAAERRAALADALQVALSERYVVERELGRGGMATVYLARDIRHERAVAVKVLSRDVVAPGGAARFLQEIRTAAGLTHPHVLGVHDSGDANGLLYYVMPYVEGETLRTRLSREGALPLAEAVRLVRELADALAYAHAHGIVHRDLKPENVLLAGGHAVVADFGIAKALAAATQDGTPRGGLTSAGVALGTPAYMAPEQAVGDASTDHRADLYALGVVAYEALAGAHPFGARAPQALVVAHLTEPPPPLGARRPDAPRSLVALVTQLLEKDPAARPQSADAVLRALDGATAAPAGTPSRRRGLRLATAATLLAAASVGGYAVWKRAPGPPRGVADTAPAPAAIRTVAVLPFVNTGGAAADDFFSDGMTDELAHALARLPGLRLAGRTSSYAFKGKAIAAQEIGRVLDVGALVGGTVRRASDRLRITAQLVSTADGKVLWDSSYQSGVGDVFAVQDEVTRAVVAALTPALGDRRGAAGTPSAPPGGRGTTDAEAYELYLKGRYYFLERGAANIARSIAHYRLAVARDPAFARAHAGLALAYGVLPTYVVDPTDSAAALITASARRALALDSTLADAHIGLAMALVHQLRFADSEARYRAALALEPSNVMGHHGLGVLLLSAGRTDEAVAELRRATQLDPLAKSGGSAFAMALVHARRFPEAEAAARRVLALDSTFPLAIWDLGFAQLFGGQPDSAVRTLERGARMHPDAPGQRSLLLFAYAAAGRWADAERVRAQLNRPGGDPSGGVMAAFAELVFGDREPLVRLLTTEVGQRRWRMFGCNPLLDPLWADARFVTAMRRLAVKACPLARPWPLPPRAGG
ncbi:MAG: protein kinase [Gemmatimonadaceae bacterium]